MACIRDNPNNVICCDSHPKYLKMTSIEKMRCFGDGDVLRIMKLGTLPCRNFQKVIGVDGCEIRQLLQDSKHASSTEDIFTTEMELD